MRRFLRACLPLLFSLLATALVMTSVKPATAQSGIEVQESQARNDFPNGVVFTLDATSAAGVEDARLVYRIQADGVRNVALADCVGGTTYTCTYALQGGSETTLIPGADITYFWRITSGEQTIETEPQPFVYEDSRFDWKTVTQGNVTVHYYSGSEQSARAVLEAGRETLEEIGALLSVDVNFPVKIRLYATAQEMQPAILSDNAEGVITLGEVVYADTAMVSADASPDAITRHEVGHIVVRVAAGDFDLPAWLNEGTAVYAQGDPLSGQGGALSQAIENDDVFTLRQLSSASSGSLGNRVELFYGQSSSVVTFLINEHGAERFARLFRALDNGATTAQALQQVYGFDQDGLDNAWRESVGLPPRESAPTLDDAQGVTPDPANANHQSQDDGGAPITLAVGIGALTVLLAASLIGAGVVLARRG